MRKFRFLTTLGLASFFLVSAWIIASPVQANLVEADVDVDPDALLLKESGYGKWITAYIGLPEGYDVNEINVTTVMLEVMGGHVSVAKDDIQENILMVKFCRATVMTWLWSMIEHMSPHVKQEVTLEITGRFYDDNAFRGSDTIKVFFTHT